MDSFVHAFVSVANVISNRIKHMKKGSPFVGTVFARVGSHSAVNKALSKLVIAGLLERETRQLFIHKLNEVQHLRLRRIMFISVQLRYDYSSAAGQAIPYPHRRM